MTRYETTAASIILEDPETSPTEVVHQNPPSACSDSPPLAKLSPPARRRRAVSSMKGLMPLTLSPCTSPSAIAYEKMMKRTDDCLPELLARDLEISADLFASKDMTAGAPTVGLPSDDKSRARASRTSLCSPYLAASARIQILGAIEEREPLEPFMEQEDNVMTDHYSESASTTSYCSCEEAEPPSFRHRGSVVTTATSIESTGCKRRSPPTDSIYECSWIDVDSDKDKKVESTESYYNVGSLPPRSPTPPGSELGSPTSIAAPKNDMPSVWPHPSHLMHHKSQSVSGGSSVTNPRKRPGLSLSLSRKNSNFAASQPQLSMDTAKSGLSERFCHMTRHGTEKPERTRCLQTSATLNVFSSPPRARNLVLEPNHINEPEPSRISDEFLDSGDETVHPSIRIEKATEPANLVYIRPPTPPLSPRSVQSWLNSSLQPYPWTSQNEDGAWIVPLPQDAVETLRVSVACFPETMLLTSSLTIDTIRSYAKKVRQPLSDASSMTGETSLSQSPRKSLWRKVVTHHKRGPQAAAAAEVKTQQRSFSSCHGYGVLSPSVTDSGVPKPWTPLKYVFGCSSDYICDALYAHIVAYNYVSVVVARSPMPLSGYSRTNSMGTGYPQQQDNIPRKAASLLGLSAGGDTAASISRFSKRLSTPLADWRKEGMTIQRDITPTAQDSALRVIQSGLLQCISRLVATAKLMAENGSKEEGRVEMETADVDMLFMRSLCEIVRMAEESF